MCAQHASSGAVAGSGTARSSGRADPWLWLAGGALLFVLVPRVGADLLGLQPDLYYLGSFTIAVAWFVAFVLVHDDELRGFWHHHLGRSLLVGLLVGPVLMAIVLNQSGTDRPDGWRLAFEVLWRGLVYGAVDARSSCSSSPQRSPTCSLTGTVRASVARSVSQPWRWPCRC